MEKQTKTQADITKKRSTKQKKNISKELEIIRKDPYLRDYREAIEGRHNFVLKKLEQFTNKGKQKLSDFANGYNYFGLHKAKKGWVFREWAPNATAIYLIGDFNNWQETDKFKAKKNEKTGNWELKLSEKAIKHGDHYKLKIYWENGSGERIPAWTQRVVQDSITHIFSAQVWQPEAEYEWKIKRFKPTTNPLLIYECHIGMAQEEEKVGTYIEFKDKILPRVIKAGYNCIQIMAIQEHPYYGSFGYHVSSFFAPSSRFGTPEELKELIDEAHKNGIAVIMDIVHSHAVKNENEGLGNFAGDIAQYFYPDNRREHPAWDSLCFDYGKDNVLHFLLSNCKYWLEEYHFDGFRFDGVTSMLYYDHGVGKAFTDYSLYFDGNEDNDAYSYLALANQLIHQVYGSALTIAEEMSGMPGVAAPIQEGGMGFDYKLSMGIPDYWIKLIKEVPDYKWHVGDIYYELTNKRQEEKTISYAESHDQALVGDKTIFFRLTDKEIYTGMSVFEQSLIIDRAIALHKVIRLVTITTSGGGYLNFMGNEWGHPEWIDFPRMGNCDSYAHARRQWSLVDDPNLKFKYLNAFDKAMIHFVKESSLLEETPQVQVQDIEKQILVFSRGGYLFVFSFNPTEAFVDYAFPIYAGKYIYVLNTDNPTFGGQGLINEQTEHFTQYINHQNLISLYIPPRIGLVLKRE